jgi:hypothetical protein
MWISFCPIICLVVRKLSANATVSMNLERLAEITRTEETALEYLRDKNCLRRTPPGIYIYTHIYYYFYLMWPIIEHKFNLLNVAAIERISEEVQTLSVEGKTTF